MYAVLCTSGKLSEPRLPDVRGPRPTGRPWTPADDAQLLALLESKMDITLIARKLQRSVQSHNQPKEPPEKPACRARAEGEGEMTPARFADLTIPHLGNSACLHSCIAA